MKLEEYKELALRTESHPENFGGNLSLLKETLSLFIDMSEILDGLKKSMFYKNNDKLDALETSIATQSLRARTRTLVEMLENNESLSYDIPVEHRLVHGIIGICTEAGELAEPLLDLLENGGSVDKVNIHEEMHDISWYMAILHDTLDLNWDDGLKNNIGKLKVRFPEKFTINDAANRNLISERLELERNN